MDGDIAPLADITQLARQYDAITFVDDCHSTGFLGANGRGTDEHCGVSGQVDVINSTLGKALGGATGESAERLNAPQKSWVSSKLAAEASCTEQCH